MIDNEILFLTGAILLEKIKDKQEFNNEDYEATEVILKKFLKNLLVDDFVKPKKELINNECKKCK